MSAIPVVQIVGNSDGGGTRFVVDIMERLDPTRFHFTLIAPQSEWLADACARVGATFRPLPLMSSRFSAALSREFRSIVADTAPMIVHAHGTRAAWLATRSLSRGAPAPALIYSEHLFSMDARRGPFKLPWYAIERAICRRAALITTSCAANADRVIRAGWATADRIALRHYGIAQDGYPSAGAQRHSAGAILALQRTAPLIGSVGRLIPQKGFTYLLHAMKQVSARYPERAVPHCWGRPAARHARGRKRKLGIAGHVRFLGAQSTPWAALATCDVIALPSVFEGLPLALLEALTLGLPVVATQAGGAAEVLSHGRNGLLAPMRDASALAHALDRLLGYPPLREEFRAAGPRERGRLRSRPSDGARSRRCTSEPRAISRPPPAHWGHADDGAGAMLSQRKGKYDAWPDAWTPDSNWKVGRDCMDFGDQSRRYPSGHGPGSRSIAAGDHIFAFARRGITQRTRQSGRLPTQATSRLLETMRVMAPPIDPSRQETVILAALRPRAIGVEPTWSTSGRRLARMALTLLLVINVFGIGGVWGFQALSVARAATASLQRHVARIQELAPQAGSLAAWRPTRHRERGKRSRE